MIHIINSQSGAKGNRGTKHINTCMYKNKPIIKLKTEDRIKFVKKQYRIKIPNM